MGIKDLKFDDIITIENLFQAWDEFKKEKRNKNDVQKFEYHLEDNIFNLYNEVRSKKYWHGEYQEFYVTDPKRRHIHKSSVRDRVLHHLLYKYLYELFDKNFIYDSYSCRKNKGTHRAVKRLEKLTRKLSRNFSYGCWSLKCDIKKFFASVDHPILKKLISREVKDPDLKWLVDNVIDSFNSELGFGRGIPLGNLTSQIFSNIYLNELDQFVKHELQIKHYLRYADDFLILTKNSKDHKEYLSRVGLFLKEKLKVELHPNKVCARKLYWGIDFCGYIVLPHYTLPRTKTKRRILKKIKQTKNYHSFQSYLGYFSHAKAYKISEELKSHFYADYL